jgi:hypothetical protein
MGLFSSKKKIFVATSVYNMAGDELERRNYLKDMIINNVLAPQPASWGDLINQNYLYGPGMKLRRWFKWVTKPGNYNHVGLPTGVLYGSLSLDNDLVIPQLPEDPSATILVQESHVGGGDFSWWADQWILQNEPDLIDTEFKIDYDDTTSQIVITRPDASTVSFAPVGYNQNQNYIFVNYVVAEDLADESVVTGTPTNSDPLPSESGWDLVSTNTTNVPVTLKTYEKVDITYSDATPPSSSGPNETGSTDTNYDLIERHLRKEEYTGSSSTGDETASVKTERYTNDGKKVVAVEDVDVVNEDIGGGVTKTTTTTTYTDTLVNDRWYRDDTQRVNIRSWSTAKIFIYQIGSGNAALDALIDESAMSGTQFFPHIPVRIDNKMISEMGPTYDAAFAQADKAYKRAVGDHIDTLIEKVAENESLKDIDYTMVVFGVQANVIENACRKYMFRFFQKLSESQFADQSDYVTWETKKTGFEAAMQAWLDWKAAQSNESDPDFGTPEPTIPDYSYLPSNLMRVATTGDYGSEFNMEISWAAIEHEEFTGEAKPNVKVGEVWFQQIGFEDTLYNMYAKRGKLGEYESRVNVVRGYYQTSANTYERLTIINMIHKNYVYKGKSVETDFAFGLTDPEESEFIVPLHYPTFREMSLVDSTQMATACILLAFNCYKVKKIKWYQRGIFKIVLVVAVIAVSIALAPTTGGASLGILGTNIAVGSAIGLTGLAAAIAGAIANAIVAAIIMQAVSMIATGIFGAKIGLILTAIAAVVVMNVGSMFGPNGSMALNWDSLMRADNLLKMTSSVGNAYQAYVGGKIMDYQEKTADLMKEYQSNLKDIRQSYIDQGLYGNATIDPMQFVQNNFALENSDTFLARTLLTGTDIAEMSQNLLTDFSTLTLSTELPI